MKLKISEKFKGLIEPLAAHRRLSLEEDILFFGCINPIKIWGDIIIDGHKRYEICTKHGLTFKTEGVNFYHEKDVKIWILRNQLDRNDLTDKTCSKIYAQLIQLNES